MEYYHRVADDLLSDLLQAFGAVLIEGPKWCGKTTTALQHARSVVRLQDPDMRSEYLATLDVKPSLLLAGDTPKLIDEWQDAPVLWDAVRVAVDQRGQMGQFILTGSNTVDKSQIQHSGTGRIARMTMLPMSLWEMGLSSGEISVTRLFDDPQYNIDGIKSPMSVPDLIFAACHGGWPAVLNIKSDRAKLLVAKNYVNTICVDDISRIDGKNRDPKVAQLILRSYARNISTLARKNTLLADITASGDQGITPDTFNDYEKALEKLFVIQNIEAWCPAIRSKSAIRSSVKRGFADPSIAVTILGLSPEALSTQLKTFGFLFEQMCIRDLRAYTIDLSGHVSYYRDRYGLEADVVLHLEDGRYALIECKLGSNEIEQGAKHLLELKHLIHMANKKETQMPIREPDLLILLTGGEMAYTRPDGVRVIPLGCLGR